MRVSHPHLISMTAALRIQRNAISIHIVLLTAQKFHADESVPGSQAEPGERDLREAMLVNGRLSGSNKYCRS